MENQIQENIEQVKFKYFPFFNTKQPFFILIILGIIFYSTSLNNEYALDDDIVIHQNNNVIKGIAGIPAILTSNLYESFYNRMCTNDQLQGGRYRPLTSITFAIEQELIAPYRTGAYMQTYDYNKNGKLDSDKITFTNSCGKTETNYEYNNYVDLNNDGLAQGEECYTCWDLNKNFKNDFNEDLNKDGVYNEIDCQVRGASLRHFNNIWLYLLACLLFYIFLKNYALKNNPDIAFLAALIFLIHPIHSEVVANIKGRDDILSMIFIILTLIFSLKYIQSTKFKYALIAGISLAFAVLSKEVGMLLLIIVPLSSYVFSEIKLGFKKIIPLYASLLFFCISIMALRFSSVTLWTNVFDTEILNNPFLFASGEQQFATKIFILLKYLRLQLLPHPLISNYSFNAITLRNFASWDFWLSLLVHLYLIFITIKLLIKKNVIGYALFIYLLFIFSISNLFFPRNILMLEANTFHASLGFVIVIAWLYVKGLDKLISINLTKVRNISMICILILIFLCGCKTWERNWDWKNDITLFLKDVKNSPNSVLILGNAGARWIDLADTKEITGVNIAGKDSTIYNDYNGTLKITPEELKLSGYKTKREVALHKGIDYLKHAVKLHPKYVNGLLNLGLAHYKLGMDKEAILYWKKAETLYPKNPYLLNYYSVYYDVLCKRANIAFEDENYVKAITDYSYAIQINKTDPKAYIYLSGCYYKVTNFNQANLEITKALSIQPDNKEALKLKEDIKIKSLL